MKSFCLNLEEKMNRAKYRILQELMLKIQHYAIMQQRNSLCANSEAMLNLAKDQISQELMVKSRD
jgi:hypothetical protein